MAPPSLKPPIPLTIRLEPLTPASFSPFGTAISCPFPSNRHAIPALTSPISPLFPGQQPDYVVANQATALKYAPISPLASTYPDGRGDPLMSMFVCFPRNKDIIHGRFEVKILERHPYTTQTFTPLGLRAMDTSTCFLVVVAPSLSTAANATDSSGQDVAVVKPPEVGRIRAFIAHGGQAVTYAAGTWHAPMVVLGKERVEFVVTQFVSGVPEEDCQEVTLGDGIGVNVSDVVGGRDVKL